MVGSIFTRRSLPPFHTGVYGKMLVPPWWGPSVTALGSCLNYLQAHGKRSFPCHSGWVDSAKPPKAFRPIARSDDLMAGLSFSHHRIHRGDQGLAHFLALISDSPALRSSVPVLRFFIHFPPAPGEPPASLLSSLLPHKWQVMSDLLNSILNLSFYPQITQICHLYSLHSAVTALAARQREVNRHITQEN